MVFWTVGRWDLSLTDDAFVLVRRTNNEERYHTVIPWWRSHRLKKIFVEEWGPTRCEPFPFSFISHWGMTTMTSWNANPNKQNMAPGSLVAQNPPTPIPMGQEMKHDMGNDIWNAFCPNLPTVFCGFLHPHGSAPRAKKWWRVENILVHSL